MLARIAAACAVVIVPPASIAEAAETISYSYDRLGRLTAISRAGGPTDGVVTTYAYDSAGNRTQAITTGASSPCLITVPTSEGFVQLPVPDCRAG